MIATLLVKKFVVIYENMKFLTLFTKDRHWIQSTATAYSKTCVCYFLSHWRALNVVKFPKQQLHSIITCIMTVKYDKHFQSEFVNYLKNGFVVCVFANRWHCVQCFQFIDCLLCNKSVKTIQVF